MTTRAATFTAKIRNLKDYHSRMINGIAPVASGADIANTLKYFSQALLGVLKDVPLVPSDNCIGLRQRDNLRLSVFPNLNYSGLYQAVRNIIDVVRLVQNGQHALGESILSVIGCLVPFLETDVLDSLPYTVATTLATFPSSLHKNTMELLCTNLLPVTLGGVGVSESSTYATESTAAIMMLVFQNVPNAEYHSMLLECLMSLKKNTCKDLLCVIAYGPPAAREPAVNHLFFYWPQLNPSLFDRRGTHHKFCGFEFVSWKPVLCQRDSCPNAGNVPAVKMCLDPTECTDHPPPLHLCSYCAAQLSSRNLVDILQPVERVSITCENKNCSSSDNMAVCTCYSVECASADGFRPIRYCAACHRLKHIADPLGTRHIYHTTVPSVWSNDVELQGYIVDAIVSLLKEAEPLEDKRTVEMGEERSRPLHSEDDDAGEYQESDDKKLLSRYGVWLLVELTTPKEDASIEILGRLLGMLFQWFDATAYLPDDGVGNALNMLKPQYLCNWLAELSQMHFEVVISCLLPHPPEYAQVGGYCDSLVSRTVQIREGLNRLLCLAPYGIISFKMKNVSLISMKTKLTVDFYDQKLRKNVTTVHALRRIFTHPWIRVWDYVMAFWIEAIRTEVPENERNELKVLICKAFDSDMSPLSFGMEKMYHFISERFDGTATTVQEQCLEWLQILTSLETFIPIDLLVTIFQTGIISSGQLQGEDLDKPENTDENAVLKSYIMMLDILIQQTLIQSLPEHNTSTDPLCKSVMRLLTNMLRITWHGRHTCCDENTDDQATTSCTLCDLTTVWFQLSTRLIQFFTPEIEYPIPVQDLPITADGDESENTVNESEQLVAADGVGKRDLQASDVELLIDKLPADLELVYSLLKVADDVREANARYYWLSTLKQICCHANCLRRSDCTEELFVKHCLKNMLMPSLWKLLKADNAHVAQVCVTLLVHCITLPYGADILWTLVECDFNKEDWKIRFSAVEKVTVLARLLNSDCIQNQQIKTAMAHAFCYLIGSLNDINLFVIQRTALYLETIKASSIRCLIQCLEFQFDTVIADRTMILHKLFLLSNVLKDQDVLNWDFFLNRFDSLCLEAQLDLDSNVDESSLQDLQNSDRRSEKFIRKINYARFALAKTGTIRSVGRSLLSMPPYRRATSAPMNLHLHGSTQRDKDGDDKTQSYSRQQSAPQFRSRGSRIGLGMFANYLFPGGNLREFTDGESNFAALLQRAMEMEGVDRQTLHHLITILMKFMSHCDQDCVHEDRDASRAQNSVLKHLNALLGYNQQERRFIVPPYKLRYSAVFNAYIFGLAKVLDGNFALGNIILPLSLNLLQHCPSPQRYASDSQPPNYSLWLLEPYVRQCWLTALLVILYKYQYNVSSVSETVQTLVRIAINTIDAKIHQCRTCEMFGPSSPHIQRTRDASKISTGDLENIIETETPPQSPQASESGPFNDSNGLLKRRVTARADFNPLGFSSQGPEGADAPTGSPFSSQPSTPTSVLRPSSPTFKKISSLPPSNDLSPETPCISMETFIQRQQHQATRIAEYQKRDSFDMQSLRANLMGVEPVDDRLAMFQLNGVICSSPDIESGIMPLLPLSGEQASLRGVEPLHSPDWCDKRLECVLEEVKELDDEEAASEDIMKKSSGSSNFAEQSEAGSQAKDITNESLPVESDVDDSPVASPTQPKMKPNFRQRKVRKTGLSTVELTKTVPELNDAISNEVTERSSVASRRARKSEQSVSGQQNSGGSRPASENLVVDKCLKCHAVLEAYDDETISLSVICLATFIHREPALAAPLLIDMLHGVAKLISSCPYPWQAEQTGVIIPGNPVSVARQFIRCVLHQLAPNNVFPLIFMSDLGESDLLKAIASALMDFAELNCYSALQLLLEGVNELKTITSAQLSNVIVNLAQYLDCIVLESSSPAWTGILSQFDVFFRRLLSMTSNGNAFDVDCILKIMIYILKTPGLSSYKGILDPFSKIISNTIQNGIFHLQELMDICAFSGRMFTKDRDKLFLPRCIVFELVQALKFKLTLPDVNLLLLVQLVCVDAGGTVGPISIVPDLATYQYNPYSQSLVSTNLAECMRQHLQECIEFIADLHTINKVKNNIKNAGVAQNLNEDTLGSHLKAGISQFVALEFTRVGNRDNRMFNRYLPWLYHPPSAIQQGPREFVDCVGHIRVLSWLLIGSLTHTAVTKAAAVTVCQPLSLEASSFIADQIMVIMTGFAEQSKASVLHMSSLFHAFTLCQLWTMYCESLAAMSGPATDAHSDSHQTIMDFWGRVTPGILQLLSHSKVLAEMVNLHFLSLLEALQECNSTVLTRLFSMWVPILYSYSSQLTGHMQLRLQLVQNWQPKEVEMTGCHLDCDTLLKWLKRLQFRLGQIEVQSSAATQFYTV